MRAIAQTAARGDVRLYAIARPTRQREAGRAAGKPQLPRRFFLPFKTSRKIALES